MVERETEVSVASYEAAEKRLLAWGAEYRRISEALDTTASTTISRTLQHAQVHDSGAPRGTRRPRRECLDCGWRMDPRRWGAFVGSRKHGNQRVSWNADACPKCGSTLYRQAELTADGKETPRSAPAPLALRSLSSEALRIERLLRHLEPYLRDVIDRKYRIGQRDHEAARELRIPKRVYELWRRMAVAQFAEVLAEPASLRAR